MNKKRILPGMRVKVAEGSGGWSHKTGRVIFPSEVRKRPDGVPMIPGHYQPVDWKEQVAIRYDDGTIDTMYRERLIRID